MSKKTIKWLTNILLIVFIVIFLVSGFLLVQYFWNSHKEQGKFDDLANLVEDIPTEPVSAEPPATGPTDPNAPTAPAKPAGPALITVKNPETGEDVQILPQYAKAYERNPDMIGWMKMEGTKINYPVMYAPEKKDYYLHRNFDRESSAHGCFYVREACDPLRPSDNVTIYGHNMRDGSMMAALHKLESRDFWEDHPILTFDTLEGHYEYEIFSVFVTSATENKGFPYHLFVDAMNEAQFDQYVQTCKDLALYDTGITPEYGDKLITLSTCDYTVENGRLVAVARRLDPMN